MDTHRLAKLDLSRPRIEADLEVAARFFYHDSYSEYVCGQWPNCMLWNRTGTVEEKFVSRYDGPALKTSYGAALPYVSELVEQTFDIATLRFARLVLLTPNTVLVPHRDFLELGENFCRIHIPLRTDAHCWHGEAESVFGMSVGEVWFLDASKIHTACSFSEQVRTHLMLDFAHTNDLGRLFRIPISRDENIPAECLVNRPPMTSEEEQALLALDRLIDADNYRDVLAMLIRRYFRRRVPVTAVFEWLLDIAGRSRNEMLSSTVAQFRNRCLIERD